MRARHRWVLAVIAVFAIVLPSASQASRAPSLDILVTNDDGWRGPGGATGQPGVYQIGFGAPSGSPVRGSDWDAVARGYVSITPIDSDRTAGFGSLFGRIW